MLELNESIARALTMLRRLIGERIALFSFARECWERSAIIRNVRVLIALSMSEGQGSPANSLKRSIQTLYREPSACALAIPPRPHLPKRS